jgi:hypothetical protein
MLPLQVKIDHWPDRTIFNLPLRPIGAQRIGGLVMIGFWVCFVSVPVSATRSLWRVVTGSRSGTIEWMLLAFVSLIVLVSLELLGKGFFILLGRARLTVFRNRVVVTDIVGPVRWRRRAAFADIARLEVIGPRGRPGRPLTGREVNLCALRSRLKSGKVKYLLAAYPRDWLEQIAAEISRWMHLEGADVVVAEATEPEPED